MSDRAATSQNTLQAFAWILTGSTMLLALYAWGSSLKWQLGALDTYQTFPLLGLVAFSVMWSHYMVSATRQYMGIDKSVLRTYFELSSVLVLGAILLHPGFFIAQLWVDGYGLPPQSYERFVGKEQAWAVMLASVALIMFLAYELRRVYENKSWWPWIGRASDIAMLAIIVHSLQLGSHLQTGWFQKVWYFYAVTLVGALLYKYAPLFKKN